MRNSKPCLTILSATRRFARTRRSYLLGASYSYIDPYNYSYIDPYNPHVYSHIDHVYSYISPHVY